MEIHVERGRIRALLPNITGVVIRNETSTYEFPGAVALPGFVDAHCHVMGLGMRLTVPSLHNATSASECVSILRNATPQHSGWIHAMGWNETAWPDAPHRSLLDYAFPTTPVIASRIDGHTLWANAEALRRAGVTSESGIVSENARDPIFAAMPKFTDEELTDKILTATKLCSSLGITEVHDMDVAPSWVQPFRDIAESGRLPLRVQSFVSAQNNEWINEGILPAGGEYQRTAGIKMYSDGALGSRTASLLEPYADAPDGVGELLLTKDEITSRVRSAIDEGWWCVAVHAIGDNAVHEVLDAYEEVRSWPDGQDILLRIEHAQIVQPEDVLRFESLRVWAIIQPTFATSDAEMAESRLGQARTQNGYRWRSLLDARARIAGSSDFPIESVNPLHGIDAFVRRVSSRSNTPWMIDERITQNEAVLAYTEWAHEACDLGYRRGKLEVGYDADIVILDVDPRTCDAHRIAEIKVMATFSAGIPRYMP